MGSKRGGRQINPGGRPPKKLSERVLWGGKIRIGISPAAALQLQELMLRDTPGVGTPEQMVEWLIVQEIQKETIRSQQ